MFKYNNYVLKKDLNGEYIGYENNNYEEIFKLKTKELRKWIGPDIAIRNIKYMLEGTKGDKLSAIRNIRFYYKNFHIQEHEYLFYPLVFCLAYSQFEKDLTIKGEMYHTLFLFCRNTEICLDTSSLEELEEFFVEEQNEQIKKTIKTVLRWNNMYSSIWDFNMNTTSDYLSSSFKQIMENVKGSETFKYPLPYKPKKAVTTGEVIGAVYFLQEKEKGRIKIGKTSNIKTKKFFGTKPPFEWEVIHTIAHDEFSALERYFHNLYKAKRVNGEWFSLNEKDINSIKNFRKNNFHLTS